MKCKKCHQELSASEKKEILDAMDDGQSFELICNDCFEMMENESSEYYTDYSDADSGL